MSSKTFAIDAAVGLIKREIGLAAVTADAYIGTQHDQGDAAITDIACVIDIEACKVSAGDETYTFRLVGSNVSDRSDARILDTLELGDAGTVPIETVDTVAGDRYVMRARTERQQTAFQYIDLHLDVEGTSPSITFGAFITKEIC
ncbi:hypothetical protein KM176_16490 [Pseudooceanicola sp. CBS1P-1]|uniref:Uncharacterized protein n=1 Tax=Pseudooceanicola albus TaxID=2692189 RepID=A0A6L7G425_9RHOB|nr:MULTISPECIES: hypothetical protein [Pseudooceanicola]MBT9385474.1 hypothetical protein [Pseudooceanicola endophyticus]MXN19114.1 hypothetical protein [Pseudooceanicola albus]